MSAGDRWRRPATGPELRGKKNNDSTSEALLGLTSEPGPGQEVPTIVSLPCGVLSHIFDDLGPRDLASASCVCRSWRRLVALEAAANQVWRSFYSARWQLSGAHWSLRPQHNSGNSTSGCSSAISRIAISASRPISVPGGSRRSDGGDGSAACTSGTSGSGSSPSSSAFTPASSPEMRWQWAYGTKMLRLRSWSGRYSAEQVVGHKMAVRAVRLLPTCDLMATASLDRTVRLWDLRSGLPLGHSRAHGGIVRCLALDPGLLASGSSDSLVRVWQPRPPPEGALAAAGGAAAAMPLFHISSKPYILRGHSGPVSCLALGESLAATEVCGGGSEAYGGTLFSGSWDCTVRVWRQGCDSDGGGGSGGDDDVGGVLSDASGGGTAAAAAGSSGDERSSLSAVAASGGGGSGSRRRRADEAPEAEDGGWSCAGVLQYSDWVYCCAVRGSNLLVAAGSEVVVTDAATGRAVRRYQGLHDGGAVACLEGCRSGRLLFTASGDGLLLAHDLRMKQGSRVLWHHNAAVTGLAFEDPWLASASADGCIMLQDSEQALAGGGSPQRALNANCRALHCPAGQPALCLDLADQWLAAGTESGTVRLWDFTGAAAAAERAAASRAARSVAKASRAAARQQHHHQNQNQRTQQPPPPPPPLPQPQLPPPVQRHRQRRGRQQPVDQPQPQVPQAPVLAGEAQGFAQAVDPLAAAWAAGPHGPKGVGGPWAEASPSPAASSQAAAGEPSPSSSRRSGRAGGGSGGGSSDRWRHGQPQPQHPAAFQRARGPRPPPPMAPTFRYVGSGAGGSGGGAGSGMATISGPSSQQRTPRPQRP
ncbi:hypothetical protein PLESTB_001613600 [Pleodorina starrii]|uniref:F-box domain-containing protein n=1 Tax=Pleodorina starrii TaxID=330485 RepID=A0A9W6F8P8_9CHLO|nr:hypothetical protein PLESTM_000167100 [Pleodorina starrii]GLC60448.1 hypothetical protein PLESTB_001613600 [Pleodorina starrii]GLC64182.1 hypothetical protein PLESTF_000133400 [Pleodorina starrii]